MQKKILYNIVSKRMTGQVDSFLQYFVYKNLFFCIGSSFHLELNKSAPMSITRELYHVAYKGFHTWSCTSVSILKQRFTHSSRTYACTTTNLRVSPRV